MNDGRAPEPKREPRAAIVNVRDYGHALADWPKGIWESFTAQFGTRLGAEVDIPLSETLASALVEKEFAPYLGYEPSLAEHLSSKAEEISDEVSKDVDAVSESQLQVDRSSGPARVAEGFGRGWLVLAEAWLLLSLTLPYGIWAVSGRQASWGAGVPPWSPISERVSAGVLCLGSLILVGAAYAGASIAVQSSQSVKRASEAHLRLHEAELALRVALGIAVRAELRRGIPRVLGSERRVILSSKAPSLVERDAAQIVPAQSYRRVVDFIDSHVTSALGLAGPRGIGKTTILRRAGDELEASVSVYIPAPVRYDPKEFVQRIFWEVLQEFQRKGEFPGLPSIRRGHSQQRARVGGLLLLGLGLLVAPSLPIVWSADIPVLTAAGLFCIGVAAFVVLSELATRYEAVVEARRLRYLDPLPSLLAETASYLTYRKEVADGLDTTFKPLGLLEFKRQSSEKRTQLEMSRADLVGRFRQFLQQLHQVAPDLRLVIAIDELDKLHQVQDLIDIVNDLKDLFHIEGTHFLVAVSTDALDAFAARGVPARDAFDSSFDAVLEVDRLTPTESVDVLRSRAVGFPPPLALFCHAWSGGLPRDLLRSGRNCVERYASLTSSKHRTDEIVRQVMDSDITAALRAILRTDGLLHHGSYRNEVFRLADSVDGGAWLLAADAGLELAESLEEGASADALRSFAIYLRAAAAIRDEYGSTPCLVGEWDSLLESGPCIDLSARLSDLRASSSSLVDARRLTSGFEGT